jgi:hypothetical protein
MEQYIPVLILGVYCLYQIISEKVSASKRTGTVDRYNLHRAGLRIKKNYGAGVK